MVIYQCMYIPPKVCKQDSLWLKTQIRRKGIGITISFLRIHSVHSIQASVAYLMPDQPFSGYLFNSPLFSSYPLPFSYSTQHQTSLEDMSFTCLFILLNEEHLLYLSHPVDLIISCVQFLQVLDALLHLRYPMVWTGKRQNGRVAYELS